MPVERNNAWVHSAVHPTISSNLKAAWTQRHLLLLLSLRAVLSLYRHATLGVGWIVIHALAQTVPAVFVVSHVLGIEEQGVPMPLVVLSGLTVWMIFRRSAHLMTRSLIQSRDILKRSYVPGLILLISRLAPSAVESFVGMCVLAIATVYYAISQDIHPFSIGWHNPATLVALLIAAIFALSIGCFTSVINVIIRDTTLVLRYSLSIFMLSSPVFYPLGAVPEQWRIYLFINPMSAAVEIFRFGLTGSTAALTEYFVISAIVLIVISWLGLRFLSTYERVVIDIK